jgi:hypothetical protein
MSEHEMDDLEASLIGLKAYVERLGAEVSDPRTPSDRRQQIMSELRQWYASLQEFKAQNAPEDSS